MRSTGSSLACALLFVLATACGAPRGVVDEAAAEPLAELAWMSGSWVSEGEAHVQEEHWTAPAGGTLFGVARTIRGGRTTGFEHLRIEARADGVFYLASPGGAPPTEFRLTASGEREVVFENPEHDFPQRIRYWREGDVLRARADVEGGARLDFEWQLAD